MAVRVVANGGGGAVGPTGAQGEQGPAGSGAGGMTLDGATSIGAASLDVDSIDPALTDGSYIAIDAGTDKCEVRRVDGISGVTLTLQTGKALKIAHDSGVDVQVVNGFWLAPELWGATTDPAVDSFRNLINMFLDLAVESSNFGVRGRGVGTSNGSYRSSRPLFVPDKANVHINLRATDTFGFDCSADQGNWGGVPNQFFLYGGGQVVTATFDSTTDEVTFSATVGDAVGNDVFFYPRQGSTLPGGIEEGKRYFIDVGGSTSLTTTLSPNNDNTGGPVDITSNGSGEIVAVSTGLSRINNANISLDGNNIKGLNGMMQLVQQPSNLELKVEAFPVVGAYIGGQQGWMPNFMALNCHVGVEIACITNYFPGLNSELNDINVVFVDDDRWAPGSGTNKGNVIGMCHFESPARGTSQIQTLVPSAALTSGQFKLQFKNVKTGFIDWDSTAAELQTALEAHAAIGAGNVTCTQLSGTNLSDGPIRCDFTVGDLQWERWVGSTSTRIGGVLTITDSTLAGGTLSNNVIRPDGRNISYRFGRGNRITGATYSNLSIPTGASTSAPFITCEGSSISNPTQHGYNLEDITIISQNSLLVEDSVYGNVTSADGVATGIAEFCLNYARPGLHGQAIGATDWFVGRNGRTVKRFTMGGPMTEWQASALNMTEALSSWKNSSGTEGTKVDKDGILMLLAGSKTHDWGSLASGSSDSTTVTVTGAALGDFAIASMSVAPPAGVIYHAQVTASNTVTVTRFNISGSAHDPASGTLRATIVQPTA